MHDKKGFFIQLEGTIWNWYIYNWDIVNHIGK